MYTVCICTETCKRILLYIKSLEHTGIYIETDRNSSQVIWTFWNLNTGVMSPNFAMIKPKMYPITRVSRYKS